jgi:hypothetical protein
MEVDDNLQREQLIDVGGFAGADMRGRSMIESWYPRKPGFVRNLAAFPLYDSTFQWPDPSQGLPVQMNGNFSTSDIDPTIAVAFTNWAEDGKYGPAYHTATTVNARSAAIEANKADLLQHLYPKSNWPTAWQEIAHWVQSLRGKRAIMFSDMILLAPDEWAKEWDVDIKQNDWNLLYSYNAKYPVNSHVYKESFEETKHATGRYTYRPMDRVFLENVVNAKQIAVSHTYFFPGQTVPSNAIDKFSTKSVIESPLYDRGIYVVYRKATQSEIDHYRDVLDAGHKWKDTIDNRVNETEAEWQGNVLRKIWGEYVNAEQSTRTTWGFVSKYRTFFIEELMFRTRALLGEEQDKVWAEYQKVLSKSHIPLHTNSERRVAFMGKFAQLAYSDTDEHGVKFISDIEDKFDGILGNELVTTDSNWKAIEGITHITNVILEKESNFDLPIYFGSLNARVFLLNNPRVIVIAIKGTNTKEEWAVNMDFTTGTFTSIDHSDEDTSDGKIDIVDDTDPSGKTVTELLTSKTLMTVHNGFLRGARALQPGITKILKRYYEEYDGIKDVFITGHSLGAAITQLMTMMIPRLPVLGDRTPLKGNGRGKTSYRNPHAYMFASPKVGDKRFLRQFDLWSGESAQVWIDGDAITAIPPFLVPDKSQSPRAWASTMKTLESLGEADGGMGIALGILRAGYDSLSLPPQIEEFFRGVARRDKSSLVGLAAEMRNASMNNKAYRAGQVFLRLGGAKNASSFDEATHDMGNTLSIFKTISSAVDPKKELLALHNIGNIVAGVVAIAENSPDLFTLDMEHNPEWREMGRIDEGIVVDKRTSDILARVAKALEDGRAQIVGYANTKHNHKPWHVIPKSEIKDFVPKRMRSNAMDVDDFERAFKTRKKTGERDSTYHGEDYY